MADGPNIGYAALSIIPSLKGSDGKLAAEAEAAGGKAGGIFGKSFGKVAAVGLAAGVAGIGAFATKSAATFSRVGTEVQKLTRYTGLAAEDASRLRFAGEESGVGVDTMTRSLGFLSKAVVGTKLDKLKLGFKDAHGNVKPLNTDLLIIAKRFQSMPDGAKKTALAMQLFGRSGADLIPFLNKGAGGIAELEKQSDKFGQTLSGKDLAAVKASTIAHREFSAAMDGLQIQVGRYVLPIITKFATVTTSALIPAIHTVADLAYKYLGPAFSFAFDIIGKVGSKAIGFMTGTVFPALASVIAKIVELVRPLAEKFVDGFERARAFIDDKLIPAVKSRLMPVLERLAGFVKNNLGPTLAGLGGAGLVALLPQLASIGGAIGGIIQGFAILPNPLIIVAIAVAGLTAAFVHFFEKSKPFHDFVLHAVDIVQHFFSIIRNGSVGAGPFDTNNGFVKGLFRFASLIRGAAFQAKAFFHTLTTGKTVDMGASEIRIQQFALKVRTVAKDIAHGLQTALGGARQIFSGLFGGKATEGPLSGGFVSGILKVRTVILQVVTFVRQEIGDLVGFVRSRWGAISEATRHVFNVIRDIVTVVLNVVKAAWRAWGDDLFRIAKTVFGFIVDTIRNALEVVRGVIDLVLGIINGDWGRAWHGLVEIFGGVFKEIGSILGAGFSLIREILGGLLSTVGVVFDGIWQKVSGVVSAVVGFITDHWRGILEILTGPIGAAVVFIVDHFDQIKSGVSTAVGIIVAVGKGMWNWVTDGLKGLVNGALGLIEGLVNGVIEAINAVIRAYNLLPGHKDIGTLKHVDLNGSNKPKATVKPGPSSGTLGALGFASGGVVRARFGGVYANIGEGHYDEAVLANSKQSLAPFAATLAQQMGGWSRGGDGDLHLHLEMDGRELGVAVVKRARVDPAFARDLKARLSAA